MRFIPQFKRGNGETYNQKHSRSVTKHMKLTTFGIRSAITFDLRDIDSPCDLIEGSPTGRELILGLPLRSQASNPPTDGTTTPKRTRRQATKKSRKNDDDDDDDDEDDEDETKDTEHPMEIDTPTEVKPKTALPVFLSIDRSQRRADRGAYVFTFTQAHAVEAEEKLKFLLNYLEHHYHTSAVSHWLTQDACDRAEEVIWDKDTDRPISREELDLDELLDEELDF
jgi:hypothetical protein